jgi:phosphohistidine phosphatase
MKTLYLVRHAKSSWEDFAFDDFDRPLKSSGLADAYLMGNHLKDKSVMPECIISSPAARAINTAIAFSVKMGFQIENIQMNAKLYECTQQDILEEVSTLNVACDSLMVFGHDPSLSNLFYFLTGTYLEKLPTAAVAAISLPIDSWSEIGNVKGELIFMEKPKELKTNNK